MHIVVLSGGSGKRLWPLSSEGRAKQFLEIFPTLDGGRESMLMRVQRRIDEALPDVPLLFTAGHGQEDALQKQLGDVRVCVEPIHRDTFCALCLAAAYLHDKLGVSKDECIISCSSDGDAQSSFYACFKRMEQELQAGAQLVCLGVAPTYPSEKYGYAIPEAVGEVSQVSRFVEKPSAELAMELIAGGALWNTGVYAMRLEYMLEHAQRVLGTCNYEELLVAYKSFSSASFDYVVAENEPKLSVVRYDGLWRDLGTWATIDDALPARSMGKVTSVESQGTLVINELEQPALVLGVPDAVVCATNDGILVAGKSATSHMLPHVEEILSEEGVDE